MKTDARKTTVERGLVILFLALAGAFLVNLWGHLEVLPTNPPTPPEFTNTATVRLNAADLTRTGGDTSGLDCYTCHDQKKQPLVKTNATGQIVLSEPHRDIVLRHGRSNRNDNCFNCHDPANLPTLRTRDGQALKLTESSRLCGSCHGPTYRDWEIGIHGRTTGAWNHANGAVVRQDCTSCHDPHSPAFPAIKPGPAPHLLHPKSAAPAQHEKEKDHV